MFWQAGKALISLSGVFIAAGALPGHGAKKLV